MWRRILNLDQTQFHTLLLYSETMRANERMTHPYTIAQPIHHRPTHTPSPNQPTQQTNPPNQSPSHAKDERVRVRKHFQCGAAIKVVMQANLLSLLSA